MITVWLNDFFLQESKGSLHRAAVSRQDEMFRDFLETIEDLDLSDEV